MASAGLAQGIPAGWRAQPVLLWAVAAAGAAAIAVCTALALNSDHLSEPGIQALMLDWIIFGYVFAGLIAWWRRPASPFGLLMIAAGFVMFMSSLSSANAPLPYTIGVAFDLIPAVVFLHVFLAFPTGRLERRRDQLLVVTGWVVGFGVHLVGMLFGGFGPDNLVAITESQDISNAFLRAELAVLTVLMLAGIWVLFERRRETRRPLRHPLTLLVDAFALGLAMTAFLFGSAAFGLVDGQATFEWIRRVTFFAVGLAPIAFVSGLLHARLARASVGDLLVELRDDVPAGELRDALARALRDPTLELAFWLPEYRTWAGADGRPVALDGDGARATKIIERKGTRVAALTHDPALLDQPELVDAVAAAAAIALDNARLQVELRARLEELKGSRARIVEAGDAERRRLERNLHDGAQQRLVAVSLQLRLLERRINDPAAAAELVKSASAELAQSLDELRELARGLHPAALEHGLKAALDALATRAAVATTVAYDAGGRLPEPVELAAYFVASEALTNVAKYAQATEATVRVWRDNGAAMIEIADDGIGGADDTRGSGLRGLADRVEALDGSLRVVSPPGAGTVVTATLPCGS
ncbi:MAG TPA: histidine kinase [Solirubrobacteraceae bacterium]|nr:histidine kinase [Solirubrobacteraceae bacterium]